MDYETVRVEIPQGVSDYNQILETPLFLYAEKASFNQPSILFNRAGVLNVVQPQYVGVGSNEVLFPPGFWNRRDVLRKLNETPTGVIITIDEAGHSVTKPQTQLALTPVFAKMLGFEATVINGVTRSPNKTNFDVNFDIYCSLITTSDKPLVSVSMSNDKCSYRTSLDKTVVGGGLWNSIAWRLRDINGSPITFSTPIVVELKLYPILP